MKYPDKTLILISGKKRAGKDTASAILKGLLVNSEVTSFAKPLKEILAVTLGVSIEELEDLKNDETNIEIWDKNLKDFRVITNFRRSIQALGTEGIRRWFGEGIWAETLIKQPLRVNTEYLIVSDWRYVKELEVLKHDFGQVITIRIENRLNTDNDSHSSERDLEGFTFDYTIDNTSKDDSLSIELLRVSKELQ